MSYKLKKKYKSIKLFSKEDEENEYLLSRKVKVDLSKLSLRGKKYGRWSIWWSSTEYWNEHNCGDCGSPVGGTHYFGCDVERCPICNGQLISCDCGTKELSNIVNDKLSKKEIVERLESNRNIITNPDNYSKEELLIELDKIESEQTMPEEKIAILLDEFVDELECYANEKFDIDVMIYHGTRNKYVELIKNGLIKPIED